MMFHVIVTILTPVLASTAAVAIVWGFHQWFGSEN